MTRPGPDDLDDPLLTTPAATRPSFWRSVRWRARTGLVLCLLTGAAFYALDRAFGRRPQDAPRLAGGGAAGVAVLWVASRVGWAWLEWPSGSAVVRGTKAVLRYLLFDAAAERRAGGTIEGGEPPEDQP